MPKISSCPNFNHRRQSPPVRFCLNCGEIVNPDIPATRCTEEEHARKRKDRCVYCVNCGERLRG